MTIESTTLRTGWLAADGSNKDWDYAFPLTDDEQVLIYVRDADGVITEFDTNFVRVPSSDVAGYVTYPETGAALGAGYHVRIERAMPFTQSREIGNQGTFYPDVHEQAFDDATMRDIELNEKLSRALLKDKDEDYWDALDKRIINVADPVDDNDAVNKSWLETVYTAALNAAVAAAEADAAATTADRTATAADRAAAEVARIAAEAAQAAAEAATGIGPLRTLESFGVVFDYDRTVGLSDPLNQPTDNIAAIDEAVAWAIAGGGAVFINGGDAYTSGGIRGADYLELNFNGRRASFFGTGVQSCIWFDAGVTRAFDYSMINTGLFRLANFAFRKVGDATTGYGFYCDGGSYFEVDGVFIFGFERAAWISDSHTYKFVNNTIRGAIVGLQTAYNIDSDGAGPVPAHASYTNSAVITGNDFGQCSLWGAYLSATSSSIFSHNTVQGCGSRFDLEEDTDPDPEVSNAHMNPRLSHSGTTATGITQTPHLLNVGDWIYIANAADAFFNGNFQVDSVANAYTFTYTMAGSPATISALRVGADDAARAAAMPVRLYRGHGLLIHDPADLTLVGSINHFEYNIGFSDVHVINEVSINGTDATIEMNWIFLRFDNEDYVAHNISFDIVANYEMYVDANKAAFPPRGDYVVDGTSRSAVYICPGSATPIFDDWNAIYGNVAERGPYIGPYRAVASGRVTAAGALVANTGEGISNVGPASTGVYYVTLARSMGNTNYKVVASMSDAYGFIRSDPDERSATVFEVRTTTSTEVLADRSFEFTVYAGKVR